jgi:ADP-heptose:LPS heptosyltransferase
MNKKDKTILIGPWFGELGWELFCWQGYARKIAEEYSRVIVISRSGHNFLYKDFANEFIGIDLPLNASSDSWMCNNLPSTFIINILSSIKYNVNIPATNIGFILNIEGIAQTSKSFIEQKFVKFQSNTLDKNFDIILHPRNKNVGNDRNWNKGNWQNLVDLLSENYKIAIIGNHEAFSLNNVDDYRNISIEDTVSLMNRCRLVVGQSSGPLHLASLSGTPHLVWSTDYNRKRYTEYWNPFKTPVYFYSDMGWNPSVDFIYKKIVDNIKKD